MEAATNSYVSSSPVELDGTLKQRLGRITARTVGDISADSNHRLENYKTNIKLLAEGVFYQNNYYTALQDTKQTKSIEWYKNRNYFYHTYPPKHFENIPDKANSNSGFDIGKIRLKEGALPSEALKAAKKGLALLDCNAVCQIGQYQALHDAWGEKTFNRIFSHETGTPMMLSDYDAQDNPLLGFLKKGSFGEGRKGSRPVKVGDRVAFSNDPRYAQKHALMGDFQAISVSCIDDTPGAQRYVALGLPSGGCQEEGIEEACLSAHNQTPMSLEPLTDELANQLFIGGKQGYAERNAFFDPTNTEDQFKFLERIGTPKEDFESSRKAYQDIDTISLENVLGDFGYLSKSVFRFDVKKVQAVIDKTLTSIK